MLITAPVLATVLSDNFSTNLANWTVSSRGLENNAAAGYDAPVITAGAVVLGGTTTSQYWFGNSLESVKTFDSRQPAEVTVKRVALTGSGTAYRSSVWIHGGDSHYLHLSQNVGEGGWSYNARAASGIGNLNPTGGGNNLVLLDPIDGDQEVHTITLRLIPAGGAGKVNIEMFVDGILAAVHGFTTFPNGFRLILTGQGRATGDMVSASFDDVVIKGTVLLNLPPVWTSATYSDPTATAGVLHSPLRPGGLATDPEGGILTFSKVSGPAWVTVQSNNGAFSGTPGAGDTGIATVVIRATDPAGNTTDATWTLRVQPAGTGPLVLTGWWPLNDGQGTRVRNLGTGAADGVLANELTGGLGPNGESWVTDPDYGMVASFAGEGAGSSWIGTGTAEEPWMIPADLLNTGKFTMSCRVKVERTGNNDIVIGNRYKADGTDFAPLQFQKLTTSNYEWYNNGGQFIDIANLPQSVWAHHTVIKDGGAIFYYLDGNLVGMRNVTLQLLDMPFYIGGQGTEAGGAIEPPKLSGILMEKLVTDFKTDDFSPKLLAKVGDYFIQRGDEERAASCFNRLLQFFPQSVYMDWALTGLGKLAYEAKDFETAQKRYTQAVEEHPGAKYAEARIGLARVLFETDQVPASEKLATELFGDKSVPKQIKAEATSS